MNILLLIVFPILILILIATNIQGKTRNRVLNLVIISGLILLLFPVSMSFFSWVSSGFEGSMFSEGGAGHATWIWFYFYVGPPGLFLLATGSIIKLVLILMQNLSQKP